LREAEDSLAPNLDFANRVQDDLDGLGNADGAPRLTSRRIPSVSLAYQA
jgi:hypothetical protein